MREHLNGLAVVLCTVMERELPKLGSDWWAKGVLGNLTPQQAQIAKDNHWSDLPDLDLAALIQVVDRNWNLLADKGLGKRETRNWLKESLTVRHRWAHESPGRKVSHDQAFRDLDTLDRLARALLPESQEAEALSHARAEALRALISTAAPTEPEPTATSPAEELPLGSKPLADPTNDSDQVRELQVRAPRIFRTQAKADSPGPAGTRPVGVTDVVDMDVTVIREGDEIVLTVGGTRSFDKDAHTVADG